MKLLIGFLLLAGTCFGQIGTGEWRLHVPAFKAIDTRIVSNVVYTAYENGVSQYDLSSNELSTWTAIDGLSDISISCLGVSGSNNSLFIGYENGNVDKLKDNKVTNIPAILLANVQGSKKIHRIVEHGAYVYCATGFSIVKLDPAKNEVRDTYYPTNGNDAIVDIAFKGDSIFALTPDRMYSGDITNPALADPTEWTQDIRVPVIPNSDTLYSDIEYVNNELFIARLSPNFGYDSVYQVTNSGLVSVISESFTLEIRSMHTVENKLAVCYYDNISIYNGDFTTNDILYTYSTGYSVRPNALVKTGSTFYIADEEHGLMELNGISGTRIAIIGPPGNNFYKLDWENGKLAVAKGSLSGKFHTYTVAGGYLFQDEAWKSYDMQSLEKWQGKTIYDVITVSINPANDSEMALGSFSFLPITIVDLNAGTHDTLTPLNADLELHTNGIGETFISDLTYDDQGNLWVLNSFTANCPLKVYTADHQWATTYTGTATKNKLARRLNIDYNGNKWFQINGVGLIGVDDGGTPTNTSDDKYITLNIGETTGALPSNDVTAIAVDFDNEIWIGTDNGFAVLYNSDAAFDAGPGDYNAQRIKIEYEGNVEYVLGSTEITDIEVDGGNRKWFGTANAGIILLSADGQEIIEQHTTDNSPLISNNIIELELDHNTGELFIITDKGLVSYRTDATYEDPDYSSVTVFPNPVRPGYEGPITIQGIRYDSDVRITDTGGNLIYKTTSNGGTATWNGKTLMGEDVPTGVYLIWTAPNNPDAKGRKVGKVLVVN